MARRIEEAVRRPLGLVLTASAVVALTLVVVRGWNRPLLAFDCWSYHLPFAARLHGLGGDGFLLAPLTQAMFDGFPLLGEWLQGALWRLTGSLGGVTAINSLALVGFVGYSTRALGLPLAAQTFGLLAVPMVAIHAVSGYIDLFVGVAVAVQVIAAVRCLEIGGGGDESPRERLPGRHAIAFVAAAGVAGNTKFMGFALAAAVAGIVIVRALSCGLPARARHALAATALAAFLVASATVARNVAVHSQPFFPFETRELSSVEGLGVGRERGAPRRATSTAANLLRRASDFVLSATEIDWRIRGVEPLYNIDSNSGDQPQRGTRARTGGWWGAYVVGQVLLLVAGVVRRLLGHSAWTPGERHLVILFALLTPVIAVAPLSMILRYWLVWPLLLVTANSLLWAGPAAAGRRWWWSAALAGCFAWSYLLLPSTADLSPTPVRRFEMEAMRRGIEPAIRTHVDAGDSFCLGAEHYPMQFRYSSAIVGGDHVVEQVTQRGDCRLLPPLDRADPAP